MGKAETGLHEFRRIIHDAIPNTVVVAGLGRGAEVPLIRELWPGVRIIGVEPTEELLRWIAASPPDHLEKAALWHSSEDVTLYLNFEADQRASAYELHEPLAGERTRTVRGITLAELYKATWPWGDTLLWLDAEGAEYDIIRGGLDVLKMIRWINIEYYLLPLRKFTPWHSTHSLLWANGFNMYAVHSLTRDRRGFDAIYLRHMDWEAKQTLKVRDSLRRKRERKEFMVRHRRRRGDVK